MAITKASISVLWGGSATKSIAAGGNTTSDAFTIAADEVSGELILSAVGNSGTETGYTMDFYLLGSVDGSAYSNSSPATSLFLGSITIAAAVTQYYSMPINIPLGLTSYKIYVESNASTDPVTVDVALKALNLE